MNMPVPKLLRARPEWYAKLSLAPERQVDLETWCEANCQAHFSRQGYDFFFEDQKDYKLFETIWN
jgi:hypothetical protein